MNRKIRSISITENIDDQLINDSKYRGLTISANISRILYEYYLNNPITKTNDLNLLPTIKRK